MRKIEDVADEIIKWHSRVPRDILINRLKKYPIFLMESDAKDSDFAFPKCYVCNEPSGCTCGDNVIGTLRHLGKPIHEWCLYHHPDAFFGVIPHWANDWLKNRLEEWNNEK